MAALVVGSVLSAVGAGISAYGQYQQGKSQNAIAQFNALQQEKQAQQQLLSLQTQAALQKQQADANFKLRSAEAQAKFQNADSIAQQAHAQDAVNRVNLRKRREDFARMQGEQRATIAGSGVSESSGTPLDILVDTVAKIQLDQEEQFHAFETKRRTLFAESDYTRLGGRLALAGATLDRDSSVAEAALRDAAAKGEYQAGMRAAEITRLTGKAAKLAGTYQAAGTLFSGLGDTAMGIASYKKS
jgi:hypothetical protein